MSNTSAHKTHFYSSFFKDLSLYAIEPIVSKIVSFLLIPLYTSYLLPAEFGNLQYVMSIGAFLRSFSQMGMNTAFWKFRNAQSEENQSSVSLSLLSAQVYLALIVLVGLLVFYFSFDKRPILTALLLVYFGALSIKVISENALLLARANRKPKKYLQISLLQTFILFVANYLFVAILDRGIWGVVYAYISSFTLIGLLYFPYLQKSFSIKHDWNLTFKMLKFGFPVMMANFSLLLLSLSDRWFLKTYTTDHELGLYSYTYKYADLIATFIVYTFQMAWTPIAWKIFNREDGPEYFASMKRMIYIFFPFTCFIGVFCVTLLAKLMTVDSTYLDGFEIIICLAFSHVFYGFYLYYNTTLLFKNKQTLSLIINLTVGAFTIALNFLIIPHFGMKGAAWATFVSYLVLFIFIKSISSIWYKHPSNFWKEIAVIFSMILAVGIVYYCYQLNISIYVKAVSSLFIGILYICGLQLSGYISIRFLKQQFQTVLRAKKSQENE